MPVGVLIGYCIDDGAVLIRTAVDHFPRLINGGDQRGREIISRNTPARIGELASSDLIVVDFDDPFIGQTIDPIQTLMLNASASMARSVMIDGRFVMEDRIIPGIDDGEYRRCAQVQFDGIVAKYPLRTYGTPRSTRFFLQAIHQLRHEAD